MKIGIQYNNEWIYGDLVSFGKSQILLGEDLNMYLIANHQPIKMPEMTKDILINEASDKINGYYDLLDFAKWMNNLIRTIIKNAIK